MLDPARASVTVRDNDSGAALESTPVSPERVALARSPESMRPGELVVVDESGRAIVGKPQLFWGGFKSGLLPAIAIGAAVGLLSTAVGVSIWWFIPFLLLPGFFRGRRTRALMRVQSKLAAADLAGAEEALAAAPRPKRGRLGALRARLEGYLAYGKGNIRQAIDHFERSLEISPRGISAQISRIMLMEALARDDQHERARQVRTEIDLSGASNVVVLMLAQADLTLAITTAHEADIDDQALHEWVRAALEHNSTRNVLILLARVLHTRQDAELSDHCLREAANRFDWLSFEKTWPDLHAWAAAQVETRGEDA